MSENDSGEDGTRTGPLPEFTNAFQLAGGLEIVIRRTHFNLLREALTQNPIAIRINSLRTELRIIPEFDRPEDEME